ncbi:MAG TPA: hypothetical protein VHB50_04625 [Bryobacteraceae bacterium]|nr:hypothetical protein [Bryobacteraceae bacterium]
MKPVRTLLARAIDYAGMFPPASLSLEAAVANYVAYLAMEDAWALGRFVLSVTRLEEMKHLPVTPASEQTALVVPAGYPVEAGMADVIEVKASSRDEIRVPPGITAYFEVPAELIPAVAAAGGRAKVRTGGATVPDSLTLAQFISECEKAGIPFKATAGLHHPFRGVNMHGFVNLLLAATLIWHGGSTDEARDTLDETNPAAFRFEDSGVRWHSHHFFDGQLAAARRNFAIGFGSCSFEEPLEDLRRLGLL